MSSLDALNVKIFADGADIDGILKLSKNPLIKGFTTNPTLIRKVGVTDYEAFARKIIEAVPSYPVSFEVFADDFDEMIAQGRAIATWGENVNVKVPVTDTKGNFAGKVIETLSNEGVVLNVTAIMTPQQVAEIASVLNPDVAAIISVFAGRVADTGIDPMPLMRECKDALKGHPKAELLWASPRELLNIFHADEVGCQIITVTHDVLAKLSLVGKDLDEYSRETVQMFYKDATAAAFTININALA
ncbi:transaldolase [Aurantimonas sp. MSK8Z-1]|uniref:transaldolase n=1 Tax=Mangrovibrevibacter kandeliae TaxID=2968473 RepID=UPI002118D53E|nr:transaldolase [Aurantimonas sp. MSK8Z-1]MCW4117018.1 transaldolase [Aurantimonas sp. MSK8Z-1]